MSSTWKPSVGTRVKIQGLQGRADLNGRIGRVIKRWDKKTGRIAVKVMVLNLLEDPLPASESVSIKPMNIVEAPMQGEVLEDFLEGFQVVDSGDATLGDVSVASQDYRVGDAVLVEPPTLVFDPHTEFPGLFDAYLRCSEAQQAQIMGMYCPSLEGNPDTLPQKVAQIRQRLQVLEYTWNSFVQRRPEAKEKLSLYDAKRLLRIIDVNAHSFSEEDNTGTMVATNVRPREDTALFARGAKVEHSCSPNLTYTTRNGKLLYRASRSIAKGDRVSISYQTSKLEFPRDERRQFLMMEKEFKCHCTRCEGPDECNPYYVSCPTCNRTKVLAFSFEEQGQLQYRCVSCHANIEASNDVLSQLAMVEEYENRLRRLEYAVKSGQAQYEGPNWFSKMIALQNEMAQKLHPFHWLHVKACRVMGSCAASFALFHMPRNGRSPSSSSIVKFSVYCSTIALLSQANWLQQMNAIVYHDVPFEEAVANATPQTFLEDPRLKDIEKIVDKLREGSSLSAAPEVELAHPLFHAGQDWLLAGDYTQVAELYAVFLPVFQRWDRLDEQARDKIAILVQSKGAENPFPNHLLRE